MIVFPVAVSPQSAKVQMHMFTEDRFTALLINTCPLIHVHQSLLIKYLFFISYNPLGCARLVNHTFAHLQKTRACCLQLLNIWQSCYDSGFVKRTMQRSWDNEWLILYIGICLASNEAALIQYYKERKNYLNTFTELIVAVRLCGSDNATYRK